LGFDEMKEQVMEGFASWLRFCHGIAASTLASHPFVHTALSSLNTDQFLEAAVNGSLFIPPPSSSMLCTTTSVCSNQPCWPRPIMEAVKLTRV